MQLFLPHRQDAQLKPRGFETYEEFYTTGSVCFGTNRKLQEVTSMVKNNFVEYEKDVDDIEVAEKMLDACGPQEDAWAQICS